MESKTFVRVEVVTEAGTLAAESSTNGVSDASLDIYGALVGVFGESLALRKLAEAACHVADHAEHDFTVRDTAFIEAARMRTEEN